MMKTIKLLAFAAAAVFASSCYDDYKNDFDYTTTFFAQQQPYVKLLEDANNSILSLDAGVAVGGKYEQDRKWNVEYAIDETLFNTYAPNNGFELLPSDYYTVSDDSEMVVPAGDIVGRVTFSIDKSKFMKDNKALAGVYALPLKIVSSETDYIIRTDDNDEVFNTSTNKDYAIIKLTYLNAFHGYYYLTGKDVAAGGDETVYKEADDEFVKNVRVECRTIGEREVSVPYVGKNHNMAGYTMKFTFSEDGKSVTVSPLDGSTITTIGGTGTVAYSEDGMTITVHYTYEDALGVVNTVDDMLYFSNVSNEDLRVLNWEVI